MILKDSWLTMDEAKSKFGVKEELLVEWIDEGVVRCEMEGKQVARVNADDLELLVKERAHML